MHSSLGLWEGMIKDAALIRAAARAENEWKVQQVQNLAPNRLICPATIPLRNVDDAVTETQPAKKLGHFAVSLPTPGNPNSATYDHTQIPLNSTEWEPLWQTMEDLEMVGAFHMAETAVSTPSSYAKRDVGLRLSPLGGHLWAHPEDPPRALRRPTRSDP